MTASNSSATSNLISLLLRKGAHLGHAPSEGNAKMVSYLRGYRRGRQLIDLRQTAYQMGVALKFLREAVAENSTILFVGTNPDLAKLMRVVLPSGNLNIHMVTTRWVGGMLSNHEMLSAFRSRVKATPLQEMSPFHRRRVMLHFTGVMGLTSLPDRVVVMHASDHSIVLREARSALIPTMGIVDTNGDPTLVNYPIVANDDSLRAQHLYLQLMAEAIMEGAGDEQEMVFHRRRHVRQSGDTPVSGEAFKRQAVMDSLAWLKNLDSAPGWEAEDRVRVRGRQAVMFKGVESRFMGGNFNPLPAHEGWDHGIYELMRGRAASGRWEVDWAPGDWASRDAVLAEARELGGLSNPMRAERRKAARRVHEDLSDSIRKWAAGAVLDQVADSLAKG